VNIRSQICTITCKFFEALLQSLHARGLTISRSDSYPAARIVTTQCQSDLNIFGLGEKPKKIITLSWEGTKDICWLGFRKLVHRNEQVHLTHHPVILPSRANNAEWVILHHYLARVVSYMKCMKDACWLGFRKLEHGNEQVYPSYSPANCFPLESRIMQNGESRIITLARGMLKLAQGWSSSHRNEHGQAYVCRLGFRKLVHGKEQVHPTH